MAVWTPREEDITTINGGKEFIGGQGVKAEEINKVVRVSFNAQNHMKQAEAAVDELHTQVQEHEQQIGNRLDRQDKIIADAVQEQTAEQTRYETTLTKRQTDYEATVTEHQAEHERELMTRQETYEQSVIERQSGYEAELTTRQGNYERTVNTRMTAAEGTATRAAQLAGGLDSQIKQAVTGAEQANVTADAAKRIATDAKEGSGTAVKRQDGEALDFIPEVVLEGAGDSVMTSEEVKKQLIGTVQEQSYSGEVMSLPGTTVGELNGYEVYGKSVQYISPNLLTTQPSINNQITTLVDFGEDITLTGVISLGIKNFIMTETSGAIFDFLKADGTHQYKRMPDCGWEKNHTYNGVISYKFTNITFQQLVFYGMQNNYSHMSGTVIYGMLNEGTEVLPYELYTGQPMPGNHVPVQSTNLPIAVEICGKNIFTTDNYRLIFATGNIAPVTMISKNAFRYDSNVYSRHQQKGFVFNVSPGTNYTLSLDIELNADIPEEGIVGNACVYIFNANRLLLIDWDPVNATQRIATKILKTTAGQEIKSVTFNTGDAQKIAVLLMTSMPPLSGGSYATIGATYSNIQLEMGTTATAFEPYQGVTTNMQPILADGTSYTEPLRSIGDVHDTLNSTDNTITKRVSEINLRGRAWQLGGSADSANRFYYTGSLPDVSNANVVGTQMCNVVSSQDIGLTNTHEGFIATTGAIRFRPDLTKYPTLASWQEYSDSHDIIITYQLATPITHELQPLPGIHTWDGHTTICATNTPTPALWCEEWDKRCIGNPVLLTNSAGETLNPVTVKNMVLDRATGIDLETELDGVHRNMEAVQAAAYEAHEAMLNSVLEKDYNGTVLTLPDTEAGFLNDYAVYGKSEQYMSPNLVSSLTVGILDNIGTGGSGGQTGVTTNYIPVKPNTNYVMSYPAGYERALGAFYNSEKTLLESEQQIGDVITVPATAVYYRKSFTCETPDTAAKIQIEQGETATPYQAYTGQPAPDNPVPVQSVRWPLEVTNCGRNLLEVSDRRRELSGLTVLSQGGVITITGTKNTDSNVFFQEFVLKRPVRLSPGNYTFGINAGFIGSWALNFYDKNILSFLYIDQSTNVKEYTFELTQQAYYVSLSFYVSGTVANGTVFNETLYPMLCAGRAAAPFEPYEGATTSIQPVLADGTPYAEQLRSIGDVHDTLDRSNNTITQRIGNIHLAGSSNLKIVKASPTLADKSIYDIKIVNAKIGQGHPALCDKFEFVSGQYINNDFTGLTSWSAVGESLMVQIPKTWLLSNDPVADVAAFRVWLASNPLTVQYELATPIIHQFQPLPDIPTLDGYTTIYTASYPQPGLWCQEWDRASLGDAVTLVGQDGRTKNPVTRWDLVLEEGSGKKLSAELEELKQGVGAIVSGTTPAGNGLPAGGTDKQMLCKTGTADYSAAWRSIADMVYPVGSIYFTALPANPKDLFGGTWESMGEVVIDGLQCYAWKRVLQ